MGGFTPLSENLSECCPAIMSRYFSLSGRQVGPKCVFILQESILPYTICPVLIRERLHEFLLWWAELDSNQQSVKTQRIYSPRRYQLRYTGPYFQGDIPLGWRKMLWHPRNHAHKRGALYPSLAHN